MAGKAKQWICVRQRAGPLVKECRAVRPRLSRCDSTFDRTEKNRILRPPRDSAVCRTATDRMELLLACFGFDGQTYVLEWPDETRPRDFKELRKRFARFIKYLRAHHGRDIDYLYRFEAQHGAGHYHVHLTVSYNDFPPVVMEWLCKEFGDGIGVEWGKPLLIHPHDSFRRTAVYLTKERKDGDQIPLSSRAWGCSKSLRAKLPEPERFTSASGSIEFPDFPRACGRYTVDNAFGHYHYGWYIKQDPRHFVR